MLTYSEIKEREWTDKLIKQFLPVPDLVKRHPTHKRKMIKLYDLHKVQQAEQSEEFKSLLPKTRKLQSRARTVSSSRIEKLLAEVQSLRITLPRLSENELFRLGIEHYENLKRQRDEFDTVDPLDYNNQDFLKSKAVNYLWHVASSYSKYEKMLRGRPGVDIARIRLLEKIFATIEHDYPYLKEQCTEKLYHKINTMTDSIGYPISWPLELPIDHSTEDPIFEINPDLIREYKPETDGAGVYTKKEGIVFKRWHGSVVNELKKVLSDSSFLAGNNQYCDLFVFDGQTSEVCAIFEAKTRLTSQTLSTAIGQLVIYRITHNMSCKAYLVLPRKLSEKITNSLSSLGIYIITYQRLASKILLDTDSLF